LTILDNADITQSQAAITIDYIESRDISDTMWNDRPPLHNTSQFRW